MKGHKVTQCMHEIHTSSNLVARTYLTAVYISEICTFDDVTILFRNFENGHIRNIAARSTFPEMYVRNPDLLNSCLSERPLFKL